MAVFSSRAAQGYSMGHPRAEDTTANAFVIEVNKGSRAVLWVSWVWCWPQTWIDLARGSSAGKLRAFLGKKLQMQVRCKPMTPYCPHFWGWASNSHNALRPWQTVVWTFPWRQQEVALTLPKPQYRLWTTLLPAPGERGSEWCLLICIIKS